MRKRKESTIEPQQKKLLTIEEAAQVLSLGITLMRDLVARKSIDSVHVNKLRRVPMIAIDRYIERLMMEERAS